MIKCAQMKNTAHQITSNAIPGATLKGDLRSQTNTEKKFCDLSEPGLNTGILAVFFKAVGDPLRLDILRMLHHNAYGVLELSEIFEAKQSGMSHHLKVLLNAGLVVTRREGNTIFYRRSPLPLEPAMQKLHRTLFAAIDLIEISHALTQRIQLINLERTQASREFFEQNSGRFHAHQDLIASYTQYGQIINEFLDSISTKKGCVLEVGPGEGDFILDLSKRFDQVIALDTSKKMLNLSRKKVQEKKLTNVELVHGDTKLILERKVLADCITLNMVLHHTPDPAAIFNALARLLARNGILIVTELCRHDQDWARESCGDLWLGFEPNDLSSWALAAGLHEGESLYLAQRNGFQIQLRQFYN
jgi:ubiquinone/menaquinone biosynthesis C-methylase UbiE/DNA-binding transcriptional ArsR family regulator|tara:strand:+ start:685 stop:1764 length:1080 start_codon:yes stop_codon:yes gene_type:complete